MLELYHTDLSVCSQKVRIVLEEKGLPWTSRHIDLTTGAQQQPEYLKLNPKGVVPTLVDGHNVVRESTVIIEYIDDKHTEIPLRPADAYARAQMRLWNKQLDDGHHEIATATLSMGIAFRHKWLGKGKEACEALINKIPDPVKRERRRDVIYNGVESRDFQAAVGMWEKLLKEMEFTLSQKEWLTGDTYSLADAAYTPYITRLDHLNLMGWLATRPKLSDWYRRVRERPSYSSAVVKWENADWIADMKTRGSEAWKTIPKF